MLAADLLMTKNTGTILWRPPEIFALANYGTSAEVYRYTVRVFFSELPLQCMLFCSYGIVLWGILCRENPYKDHNFKWIEDVSLAPDPPSHHPLQHSTYS